MIELLQHLPKGSMEPLSLNCAGQNIQNMWQMFIKCFVFLLIVEMGAFKFIGRPLLGPLWLRMKHAAKFLGRKKRQRMYRIRKDFNKKEIGSSSEEEEEIDDKQRTKKKQRDNIQSALVWKFQDIKDSDPVKEEQRVLKSDTKKSALTISKLNKSYVFQ